MSIDQPQRAAIAAWLRQLDESVLIGWANRGLLRRARAVLGTGAPGDSGWSSDGLHCSVEERHQSLGGPGFQYLRCSCPASGPCHHALAALLHWSATVANAEEEAASHDASDPATPPFWNQADWAPLARALGAMALRRAAALLEEGQALEFEPMPQCLQAHLRGDPGERVRFDAALGAAAAVCTCARPRCAHAAAALLHWRRGQGLDTGTPAEVPRRRSELAVLQAAEALLLTLADEGLAQLSRARLDEFAVLARRCRQTELPALAHDLLALHRAAAEELARRSRADSARIGGLLARAWARLRALQTRPSPQPRARLMGRHRRDYRPAPRLDLDIVALERWDRGEQAEGYSLHAWCHATRRWWRLPAADYSGTAIEHGGWREHRWCGRELPALLGRRLRLSNAWASADASLSAREDTRWEDICEPGPTPPQAPATLQAFGGRAAVRHWLETQPPGLLDAPSRICLLGPLRLSAPQRSAGLDWRQHGCDAEGREIELRLPADGDGRLQAIDILQTAWARGLRWNHALGWLRLHEGRPVLEPLGLWIEADRIWLQPHARDLLPSGPTAGDVTAEMPSPEPSEPVESNRRELLQIALIATRRLLCRRLDSGCAHTDPGFMLALQDWRRHGLGRYWPDLLRGLDASESTPGPQCRTVLDALLRVELAIAAQSSTSASSTASP